MSDKILEALERIEGRLDKIENRIDAIENFAKVDGLNTLSILTDSIDEYCAPNDQARRNMAERLEHVVHIIDQLTQTNAINTLELLIEKAPQLSAAIEQLEALPQVMSIFADSFDEFFRYAQTHGLDVTGFSENFSKFSVKMLTLFESGNFNKLLDSGIVDPEAIVTVGAMGESLAHSTKKVGPIGPVGIVKALFDPEVQKAAGFLVDFAKHFGNSLNKQD
jgi:uncharacterized protein YjgD (DUF1641 family)